MTARRSLLAVTALAAAGAGLVYLARCVGRMLDDLDAAMDDLAGADA